MLVSIIMPVYNAGKFLHKSIDSAINQSHKDIELILVNDGSTDNSQAICDSYALNDARIKVISQDNRGPAAARNTGLRNASGEFAFFLDADDFIDKHAIEILAAEYSRYHPDMVMANFSKLENNGETIRQKASFHPGDEPFEGRIKELSEKGIPGYVRHFFRYPSNHLISYCWARLYKLSIIKDNKILANEDMRLFEDFVFNLEYLKHVKKTVFVNEALYTYTMHNYHISASMAIINAESLLYDMNMFKEKAVDYFKQVNGNEKNMPSIEKEIGHALIHYAIIFLIRSCRQITRDNKQMIYEEINKIINAPILQDNLRYYSPLKGNSRVLPFLMKHKRVDLIMLFSKYKAHKRYGKPLKS